MTGIPFPEPTRIEAASMATEHLELEVCRSAAQLAGDTARWLTLIAELDRREAWAGWECRSMAHWLSWKCGMSLHTGRDHVRVARALDDLPLVHAAFTDGSLSYSKVRALTRVVSMPELEAELVTLAQTATASQLDAIATGYLKATDGSQTQVERDEANHDARSFRSRVDERGMGTLTVHLPADQLAIVLQAVEHLVSGPGESEITLTQRKADAVVEAFTRVLQPSCNEAVPSAIIVRTEAEVIDDRDALLPRIKGLPISRAAYERLRCSATVAHERVHADGSVERTPTVDAIPRRIRRAVMQRDGYQCRWPSCTSRYRLQVHHLQFRSQGGTHTLDNLACLCVVHHHAVHDRRWLTTGNANGELQFTSPRGRIATESAPVIAVDDQWRAAVAKRRLGHPMTPATLATATHEPCDVEWIVGTICDREHLHRGAPRVPTAEPTSGS